MQERRPTRFVTAASTTLADRGVARRCRGRAFVVVTGSDRRTSRRRCPSSRSWPGMLLRRRTPTVPPCGLRPARRRSPGSRRRCSRRSTPPPRTCGSRRRTRSRRGTRPCSSFCADPRGSPGGAAVQRENAPVAAGSPRPRAGRRRPACAGRRVVAVRRRERVVDDVDVGAVRRDRGRGVEPRSPARLDRARRRPRGPVVGRLGEVDVRLVERAADVAS